MEAKFYSIAVIDANRINIEKLGTKAMSPFYRYY